MVSNPSENMGHFMVVGSPSNGLHHAIHGVEVDLIRFPEWHQPELLWQK
jgi:hypothetical protein